MIKAILVDNEEPAINILRILLKKTGKVDIIETFLSASDALSRMKLIKPDVAFLDIEMPEINGLELAEKLLDIDSNIEIVFVTAYDQYALEAFLVNALDYLLKPLVLKDIDHAIARIVKRKGCSLASPDKPSNGQVYCFGKMTVYGPSNDQPVKWRTSKAEELFSYMLQNKDKLVSKWKLSETLWPDCTPEKVDVYLHTTIYKMKKVLSSANIKLDFRYSNGCYIMSLQGTYIDIIEFDSVFDSDIVINQNTVARYEKALSIYKNDYLEGNDYIWSLTKRENLSQKASMLTIAITKYYMESNEFAMVEKMLTRYLEKFPLDENAHGMLLKVYFSKKDHAAFIKHYKAMEELFKTELDIEPSNSIKALYNSMQCK